MYMRIGQSGHHVFAAQVFHYSIGWQFNFLEWPYSSDPVAVDQQGLVGINKCDYEQEYWLDTARFEMNWYRNYRDVLDQNAVVNVQSQWVRLTIPARGARMWLQE